MRTCAIGLDAGEWSLIQSLIDAGDLPNLGRLAQNGVARFENPTYRTGLVWQGFLADSAPPRNGVEFDTQSFGAFQVGALPVRPFFDSPRRRVIAIDLPLMSLAQVGNGTYVTAWGAHGAGYPRASKPSGVLTEIDSRFGPHPAFADDQCHWNDPSSVRDLRDRLIAGARTRVEIFDWLTSRDPEWDLFIMALSETHSAGESFWHGVDPTHLLAGLPEAAAAKEALLDVYRTVDDTIGRIAQKLPADTALCVFSLHGIKQNTGDIPSSYLLPELLLRLETGNRLIQDPDQDEWRRSGFPAVVPAAGEWPPSALRSFGSESPKRKAIRALKSVMPRPVQDQLRALRARGRSDGDAAFAYGHGVPDESPH
ncbi:MAG: hypothetical protein QOK47_1411, partial [Actinomycetota bacterium]|nr:hypothetical protein [Actinomycetota bacterium]